MAETAATTTSLRPLVLRPHEVVAAVAGQLSAIVRAVNPQPPAGMRFDGFVISSTDPKNVGKAHWTPEAVELPLSSQVLYARCPFGRPKDRLWIKESWAVPGTVARSDDPIRPYMRVYYRASAGGEAWSWRSPITMPQWASRLALEVVGVKVKRLQDITDAEVAGAGFLQAGPGWNNGEWHPAGEHCHYRTAMQAFSETWNRWNRHLLFKSSPRVWVGMVRGMEENRS